MATALVDSYRHTYWGNSEINFSFDKQEGLSVTMDTKRLHLRSVQATESDYSEYAKLYGDREVIEKYASGKPMEKKDVVAMIVKWSNRAKNNDPFHGLAVFKNDTDEFIGNVVLGYGNLPGESEIAAVFHKKHWNQGYGTEAIVPLVEEYAPATVKEGYLLEGRTLERITATARTDNVASWRIMEKAGMERIREEVKFDNKRYLYMKDISQKV